jgi:hypothetical protein
MKTLPCLLVLVSGIAFAAGGADQCLSYSSKVSLQGKLTRQTFAEQPNYESIAKGDARAAYFFLSPSTPICVRGRGDAEVDQEEANVKVVQLAFVGEKDMFRSLRPNLGKVVRCKGQLFHAISGHHHSRVLMETSACMPVQHGAAVGRASAPLS